MIAILFRMNSFYRTNVGTSTTICANVGIDFVDITFGNCFHRALINTCSASCAIFVNFVSHFFYY